MNTKTIKVRFTHGVLEPLDKVDIPEGKELIIRIIGEPIKKGKKNSIDALRRICGWLEGSD